MVVKIDVGSLLYFAWGLFYWLSGLVFVHIGLAIFWVSVKWIWKKMARAVFLGVNK